jgi:predicted dehydrogenase
VRVAVVGLGSIGRRHVGNLLAMGHEVFGFDEDTRAYPIARALHAALNCAGSASLLNNRLADAVVIATPLDAHLEWVEWCISRRLPFYVEKPLGTLEEVPRWRQLVAMPLPVNMVGYQLRFHPSYRAMRQLVPTPLGGAFRCDFDMSTWPGKSYGPPELEASHEIDLALDCGLGLEDVVLSRGQYYREWYVYDANASAHVSFSSAAELGDQMYVDAMAHFLECVREGKPTKVPLSDGLRVLEALA